jgi:hypothetical protein
MPIKIKLGPLPKPIQARVPLKISRTMDGNLIIDDHDYMDIVISPSEGTISIFPKPYAERDVYEYQKDLLYFLFKAGITSATGARGTSTFGMIEIPYSVGSSINPLQTVLYGISQYLKKTSADEDISKEYDENIEDRFTNPSDAESTEAGEIQSYEDREDAYQTGDPTYTFAGYGYFY